MKRILWSFRHRSLRWVVAAFGIALLLSGYALWADAKPPKNPARARPRGQRRPGKPVLRGVRPFRRVRARRYWHPGYKYRYNTWVWKTTGYRYYPEGDRYVVFERPPIVLKEGGDASTESAQAAAPDSNIARRYAHIQELTELVHEWRTLNESPSMHDRMSQAKSLTYASTIPIMGNFKGINEEFDRVTRAAMYELAEGRPADAHVEKARHILNDLTKLAEALPTSF